MNILGIETSCDETAVAIVNHKKQILSNVVWSHLKAQQAYGGVVPEISARAHLERVQDLVRQALDAAQLKLEAMDAIAATCGPGLIGGVMVGAVLAKAMAASAHKPFLAVNHLVGHALTPRLFSAIDFPYLLLLVSGGHCQLLVVRSPLDYQLMGETLDDAVGEAFDKVGKMLGISYPAGPGIELLATHGDADAYKFPKPLIARKDRCDFSFSGLKTAVRQKIQDLGDMSETVKADICASFQSCVGEVLAAKSHIALEKCQHQGIKLAGFVAAGGVAANQYLSTQLQEVAQRHSIPFKVPPVQYCTDNGAMIAWAGVEMKQVGVESALSFAPRPRWPLTDLEVY